MYRHPAPNHKDFDEKLFQVVDNLNNNKYAYFICGDFVTRRPIDASIQRVYLLGFKELSFNILETRK